jgi:hypothetical protein
MAFGFFEEDVPSGLEVDKRGMSVSGEKWRQRINC